MNINLDVAKWFEFTTLDLVAIIFALIWLILLIPITIIEKKRGEK